MSELDYRYPYPFWIGSGKNAKPYESRILSLHWSKKEPLIAGCINSIELLLTWRYNSRQITWILYQAMRLERKAGTSFEDTPQWIKLSALTLPTLIEFKKLLTREIERSLITQIDVDPEEN